MLMLMRTEMLPVCACFAAACNPAYAVVVSTQNGADEQTIPDEQ